MKRILILLLLSSSAFAEVPPPGTARKGPITVQPHGEGKVWDYDLEEYAVVKRGAKPTIQQKLDALRKRVKNLKAENDALKNRRYDLPVQVPYERERIVERTVEKRSVAPVTIFAGVGAMPDGVYIDEKDMERKAQIHEFGTAVQAGAMYHFENGVNIGLNGAVTTRDTHLQAYFGTLGYSFGSR